jgi:UPF0271 protein
MVAYQIGALQAVAALAGMRVTHVKAHGALSNVACADPATARAIATAIKAVDRELIWVVLPLSEIERAGEAANLRLAREVFADRTYEDDASLMNRSKPGAVLHDPSVIGERVLRMVRDQAVVSTSGKVIKMPIDTICVHGDTPGAVLIARAVRATLEQNGFLLKPFHETLRP